MRSPFLTAAAAPFLTGADRTTVCAFVLFACTFADAFADTFADAFADTFAGAFAGTFAGAFAFFAYA